MRRQNLRNGRSRAFGSRGSSLELVKRSVTIGLILLSVFIATYFLSLKDNALLDKAIQDAKQNNARDNANNSGSINDNSKKESRNHGKATKSKTHHCLNKDFQPQHSVGIWTMLNDNMSYVRGAIKMGKGVQAHTKTPHDLVVMELETKPLSEEEWRLLSEVGFIKCQVSNIPPPDGVKTRPDLKEKFAVLHVWAMEVYDTVLFLDADTFVQNSVDDLIHMDLQGKPLGVTKDIRNKKWVDTFNSGVMVIHPSVAEHERLLGLLGSGLKFEYVMSDQGFLNEVYKGNWHEIGFVNNANLALYRFQRDYWDQFKLKDINVIHYTMQKPWKCQSKGAYGPICDIWINAFPEVDKTK
mmetsp:Transcript_9138/g.12145  ORF Transcript_9138/g.12145 Transcript_9138/m.12145 type:complete len:354 (+) Transcript_9138:58-1119(+)